MFSGDDYIGDVMRSVETLMRFCDNNTYCENCPFYGGVSQGCKIYLPLRWEVDIELKHKTYKE